MMRQTEPDPALTSLLGMMRDMFPTPFGIGVTHPLAPHPPLLPAELGAATGMTPERLQEFKAGRHAARQAMAMLGHADLPIRMGKDRAPIWPNGLSGSLSHCQSACVAVLTSGQATVGVDIEPDAPLDDDLVAIVTTLAEQQWLRQHPISARGQLARAIFCAKEAVYKAQYPVSGELFDFDTLNVSIALPENRFSATFTRDVHPFSAGSKVNGRLQIATGFILAGVCLESPLLINSQ